jgi:hypothetical protein
MKQNQKTRIGLAGIIGIGGAAAIAIGTGGAGLPLILLASTGVTMKKIASEPSYEQSHKVDFSISNNSENSGYSLIKLLNTENKRKHYNAELNKGAYLIKQQLANLPMEKYKSISKMTIFPEAKTKIFGLPIGKKSLEVGIEYG